MNKLLVSPSPHVHSGDSIEKNMYGVLIALIPAFICSVVFFGISAVIVTLISVVACLLFEFLIQKYLLKQQPTIWDGSALITGVLLAFNVPSNLPVWILILGALVAIGVGKMSFGGLGCNIFNPALVGRIFLLISFPVQMTTWPAIENQLVEVSSLYPEVKTELSNDGWSGASATAKENTTDAQSGATPLALMKTVVKSNSQLKQTEKALEVARKQLSQGEGDKLELEEQISKLEKEIVSTRQTIKKAKADMPSYTETLIGQSRGSLGEIGALALLLGFVYMLFRKIITWHIPVSIFITVLVFAGILHFANPEQFVGPLYHLLTGGMMLGAIFMATDYVTSPMTKKGMLIYGVGIGVLTVIIRTFGAYPEGMSFAILIMNAFTPLINRYCKPVRFA